MKPSWFACTKMASRLPRPNTCYYWVQLYNVHYSETWSYCSCVGHCCRLGLKVTWGWVFVKLHQQDEMGGQLQTLLHIREVSVPHSGFSYVFINNSSDFWRESTTHGKDASYTIWAMISYRTENNSPRSFPSGDSCHTRGMKCVNSWTLWSF
jgi:hypothetical protein